MFEGYKDLEKRVDDLFHKLLLHVVDTMGDWNKDADDEVIKRIEFQYILGEINGHDDTFITILHQKAIDYINDFYDEYLTINDEHELVNSDKKFPEGNVKTSDAVTTLINYINYYCFLKLNKCSSLMDFHALSFRQMDFELNNLCDYNQYLLNGLSCPDEKVMERYNYKASFIDYRLSLFKDKELYSFKAYCIAVKKLLSEYSINPATDLTKNNAREIRNRYGISYKVLLYVNSILTFIDKEDKRREELKNNSTTRCRSNDNQ